MEQKRLGEKIRTLVTFRSKAFNTTEQREYFINDGCYGDDVVTWLMKELHKKGFRTCDCPGQEDFGWYFTLAAANEDYCFVAGFRSDDNTWIGWVERDRGLLASAFGGRHRGIAAAGVQAVHDILSHDAEIRDVRWHFRRDFDASHEELGLDRPFQD